MEKENLFKLAKELNEVLGLEPPIDTDIPDEDFNEQAFVKQINEALSLVVPEDKFSPDGEKLIKEFVAEYHKTKTSKKDVVDKKASFTRYVDALAKDERVTWEVFVKQVLKVAEEVGVKQFQSIGALKAHVRHRLRKSDKYPGYERFVDFVAPDPNRFIPTRNKNKGEKKEEGDGGTSS